MNITEMEATLRAIHTLSKHDQGDHGHHGPWGHICKACTKWERAEGWREGRKGNSAYMHEISIPVREHEKNRFHPTCLSSQKAESPNDHWTIKIN